MKRILLLLLMMQSMLSAGAQEPVDRSLTRHDFLYAGEGKQRRMFVVKDGQVAWRYDNPQGRGEISDAILMTDGHILVAHQYGICEVTQENKTLWSYEAPEGTEIHTIQPIGRDRVLFVQNGHPAKVVVMEIPSCRTVYEFEVPASEGVHGQFRNARLSSRGTLLLAHQGQDYVAEYSAEGNELRRWEYPAPWSVTELADDRLIFVGRGLVREIDRSGGLDKVVREIRTADYGIKSPQKAVRLKNGNTILNDWHNEWRTPIDTLNAPVQAIEIDKEGKVVWQLCSWKAPDLGPSTTIQPLDQAVNRDRLSFGHFNARVSQKCLSQHLLVPAWSLGHIIWEDSINTEQGAQRLYTEYAAHQIPVDGIIIDSPWTESYNDFNWDRQRYPHAEQMIQTFNNNGVKVILWLTGCVNTACKDTPKQKAANYDEAYRLRYGINDNTPSKWWKGKGLMTDFTNPKAREWWYTQLDKVFTDGVYGFKMDQGEIYFGDTVKTSVGKMTNRQFRKYYYDAISDYVRMRKPEGITIGRPYSHQGGFHSTPEKMIIGWCGDFGGDWKGLKLQIDNVYRSAQAGFGAVGCEVAGFMGAKATRLDFIRYAQFGAMTACMINGGENGAFSSHLPWFHGDDVSEIYRQCVVLHNQLRPYLFSVLVDAHLHGGGLLRRTSFEQESHLLGNDIFTKAITNPEGQANFTLPEDGEWVDYFSGQSYPGGTQLSLTYPIDRFPLFIRKGAIIPMAIDGSITYLVCPKGTTARKLYLPTGDGTDYEECDVTYSESDGQLTVNGKKCNHLHKQIL